MPLSFLILAAGKSTRYGRPKQVDPLGPTGASIMAYTVVDALRAGFHRVVMVTSTELKPQLDAHLRDTVGRDLPITWVIQRQELLPAGLRHLAASRRKPWGTGQAVLAAAPHLDTPFAVANADDWYGPEALAALARVLGQLGPPQAAGDGSDAAPEDPPCEGVAVGYPMEATLSRYGGVSRGWIQTDRGERIQRVVELEQVRRSAGRGMVGFDAEGATVPVPPGAPASMNLWGFQPCILPLLEEGFRDFLLEFGGDSSREYPLSTAVDGLLHEGRLRLRLVPEGRRWFGVTYADDADAVSGELARLHREGLYTAPLSASLG